MNEPIETADGTQGIDALRDALREGELDSIRKALSSIYPAEIADLLESLPGDGREELWRFISPEIEGDVLAHTEDSVRATLLEHMLPREVAAATENLEADDVADILQDLPETVADEVLRSMDAQDRQRIAAVLSYPEDSAGGLMNTDTISIRDDVDVDVVLRYLRLRGSLPEQTDSLFVVDRRNKFIGTLPLTDILTGIADQSVAEIMDTEIPGILAHTTATDVANLFELRDLLSAPVIDEKGQLLGRITVDDVLDVIRAEGEHSIMSMAGLSEGDDIFAPVLTSARRRAIWLAINLATAFLAAWMIGRFEATIDQLVALAILMPVVASMGGIAGSQTLTIMIRGLALGHVSSANARSLLVKEVAVAAINALLWATVVAVIASLWFDSVGLGMVIGLAMSVNLLTAAFAGYAIPLVLRRLNIDPALAGGVLLTTITDVIGFVAFLGIATLVLL